MTLITTDQFKQHARIDGTGQDEAIDVKVEAANAYVLSFLASPRPDNWQAPAELVQAALLIASHWWENRETTYAGQLMEIPVNASELISNHREWVF